MAGNDVVLIARGQHHEAIVQQGLRFVSPGTDRVLQIPCVSHPREIDFDRNDVVILCMKGQHTENALRDLQNSASDNIPVICCQNGVANERIALRRFQRVYAMVVLLPAEHLEPGVVVNFAENRAGVLDAGCFPSGVDETIQSVTESIHGAGFSSFADEFVMRQKYAKLLGNLGNALQAATGSGSREIHDAMRAEAIACYNAAGIEYMPGDEIRTRRLDVRGGSVPGFSRHGGSSLQSVIRGTGNIEADYLNGEIAQLGRLHGIPTPANVVVQRAGNRVARENLPPGTYSVDELQAMIRAECA